MGFYSCIHPMTMTQIEIWNISGMLEGSFWPFPVTPLQEAVTFPNLISIEEFCLL